MILQICFQFTPSHFNVWRKRQANRLSKCRMLIGYWCYALKSKSKSKSNLSLYSLYYAEACNELAGPISPSLRPGNTAPFEEMSMRWRAVGNTVSDLTGPRFEPQTSCCRDEHVTARPTGRYTRNSKIIVFVTLLHSHIVPCTEYKWTELMTRCSSLSKM